MGDDLISRQALMEDMRKTITESSDTFDWINLINRQPITYDVDKVVEKLEAAKETHDDECGFDDFEFLDCDIAIEIVKGGGKG